MPSSARLAVVLVLTAALSVPPVAAEVRWTHLALAQGRSDYGNGYRPATAALSGHIATLSGMVANPEKGTLATLPVDLRPQQRLIFGVNTQGGVARIDVLPSGAIEWEAGGVGLDWVSLDGISFAVGGAPQPLESAWPNYAQGYAGANAVLDGDRVYLGGVLLTRQDDDLVARLPNSLRPSEVLVFDVLVDNRTTSVEVHPDGRVVWVDPVARSSWLSLSGIAFDRASGGAQPLSLAEGWVNHGAPYAPATVTRSGDRVSLSGRVRGSSRGDIATLPAGLCPESRLVFGLDGDDREVRVDAISDCRILRVPGGGTDGLISLDGLSFYLNPSLSGDSKTAQDTRDLLSQLRRFPLFQDIFPTGMTEQDGLLTGKVALAGETATLVAWHPASNEPWVAAVLVPEITIGDLLPTLDDANRLAGATMQDVVVFAVPSGAQTYQPKVSELPDNVAAAVKKADPSLAEPDAELELVPGMTYVGGLRVTGLLETAADVMQLRQPLSLRGSVGATALETPSSEVTLEARLETDPLTAISQRLPFHFVRAADSAQPELRVTAKGKAEIAVSYTSTFDIFDQQLDGELSFETSGEGAQATTAIALAIKKPGPWKNPHLLGPVAIQNVTLHDTDIRYVRALTDSGSQDTLAVTTSKTRIFDTDYQHAAFAFTVDSASTYPKAVFADLETQELTFEQLAQLAELSAELSPEAAFNPYAKDGVDDVLELNALPMDGIEVEDPKVYLATVGALIPDDLPQRPSILGAGIVAHGTLIAFDQHLATTDVKLDYAGLRSDAEVGELSFGGFVLENTRFRIEATSSGGADAAFSGDTTIAGLEIGTARVAVDATGFRYDLHSSCIGALEIRASGSTDGFDFSIPEPSTEACVPDPLRMLKDLLAAGQKFAHPAEEVVTGLGDEAWRGLRGLGKGKITPSTIDSVIAAGRGDPEKAIDYLEEASKDLGKALGEVLGGLGDGGHVVHLDLYDKFNTPSECRPGKDRWSLEYGTCWAKGAQMIRLADQPELCVAKLVDVSALGSGSEAPNHLRLEPCIGNWNQQWQYRRPASSTGVQILEAIVLLDHEQGCWTARSVASGELDFVRIEDCAVDPRHLFRRDLRDRLVDSAGLCLQITSLPAPSDQPVLTSCAEGQHPSDFPQTWIFEDADSFRK